MDELTTTDTQIFKDPLGRVISLSPTTLKKIKQHSIPHIENALYAIKLTVEAPDEIKTGDDDSDRHNIYYRYTRQNRLNQKVYLWVVVNVSNGMVLSAHEDDKVNKRGKTIWTL